MILGDMLVYTAETLRGQAELSPKGKPLMKAINKRTGELLATLELPIAGQYGGRQDLVGQVADRTTLGGLFAQKLPGGPTQRRRGDDN